VHPQIGELQDQYGWGEIDNLRRNLHVSAAKLARKIIDHMPQS
jgi:hypothetical protein